MRVRYSTATDVYSRGLEDDVTSGKYDVKGWRNGVHSMTSILRKKEEDWKMCYLAREEGAQAAKISWVIDASDCEGYEIDEVFVQALYTTFEDGKVLMELIEGKEEKITMILNGVSKTRFKASGHPVIKLAACLRCEKNDKDVCWQHSQLFRQSLDCQNDCPLDITVTLKLKDSEESLKH